MKVGSGVLCRFHEELPGSEVDGKRLFTPPFPEHVPLPEFELYVPLLHQEPALAGATDTRLPTTVMARASATFLIIDYPIFVRGVAYPIQSAGSPGEQGSLASWVACFAVVLEGK